MKDLCSLIHDLIPLYHDRVCSEESTKIIEEHLLHCSSCQSYYTVLSEADKLLPSSIDKVQDMKKAASFHAIRKRILKKQIWIVLSVFFISAVLLFAIIGILKKSEQVISYTENISVAMVNDSLIGRLQGNQANYLKIKQVEIAEDNLSNTYLFFCLSGTKWDDLVTNHLVFSEYVLCPADKNAAQIDYVYYYTGDYNGIETMNQDELNEIINRSVLLWDK